MSLFPVSYCPTLNGPTTLPSSQEITPPQVEKKTSQTFIFSITDHITVSVVVRPKKKDGAGHKKEVSKNSSAYFQKKILPLLNKLYECTGRSLESDLHSFLLHSRLGKSIQTQLQPETITKLDKSFQLLVQDRLKISDHSWRILRKCLSLEKFLYSDNWLQQLRSITNTQLVNEIGLCSTTNMCTVDFESHLKFVIKHSESKHGTISIKLGMDNGKGNTKITYEYMNKVYIIGVLQEKKETKNSITTLQRCFESVKRVAQSGTLLLEGRRISVNFTHVTDLAGYWAMVHCKCPYCSFSGKNGPPFSRLAMVDAFGLPTSKFCICLLHCFMRVTEHQITVTCNKYPDFEPQITKLPGMQWFKLTTREIEYEKEVSFSKCPMLSKLYCVTVIRHCHRILVNINADPLYFKLWSLLVRLTKQLFIGSSTFVKENKKVIVTLAKEFAITFRSITAKNFLYLHILEYHLDYLITNFDLPSLQNQDLEHEHSLHEDVVTRKTNGGGGVRKGSIHLSAFAQSLLYTCRLLKLEYDTARMESTNWVMLNEALESKRENKKKYHNTNVDTVLQELNQLEDKFNKSPNSNIILIDSLDAEKQGNSRTIDEQDSYEEIPTQIIGDDAIIVGDSPLLQGSVSPVQFRSPIPLSSFGESRGLQTSSHHTQQSAQGVVHHNALLQSNRNNNYPILTTPQPNSQSDVFGQLTAARHITNSFSQSVVTVHSTGAPPLKKRKLPM